MNARLEQVQAAGRTLATHAPFDVLALDACYAGNLETLGILAQHATTVVVSEDQEPGEGYPYEDLLRYLGDGSAPSSQDVAAHLVAQTKTYYSVAGRRRTVTQVALRSDALSGFADAFSALVARLDVGDDRSLRVLRLALEQAEHYPETDSADLIGFVTKLLQHPDAAVRDACQRVLDFWQRAVAAAAVQGSEDGANGVAIYAPQPAVFDTTYLELTRQLPNGLASWADFLRSYVLRRLRSEQPDHPLIAQLSDARGA